MSPGRTRPNSKLAGPSGASVEAPDARRAAREARRCGLALRRNGRNYGASWILSARPSPLRSPSCHSSRSRARPAAARSPRPKGLARRVHSSLPLSSAAGVARGPRRPARPGRRVRTSVRAMGLNPGVGSTFGFPASDSRSKRCFGELASPTFQITIDVGDQPRNSGARVGDAGAQRRDPLGRRAAHCVSLPRSLLRPKPLPRICHG